jgi:cyclic pyranopterin phosphate synthase
MPEKGIPIRPKAEFMRQEEIFDLAKIFVEMGVNKIRLTGGEPLVRKDCTAIICGLSRLPVELGITTNGILVDRFIDTFEDAGIKSVNVSLDSLQDERQKSISRRNYFHKIMTNIELLMKEGITVKVNAVIMKGINDDEIIDFVNWTKDTPVDVRFIEFMPFGGNKWNWDKKVSYREIMDRITKHWSENQIQCQTSKPNETSRNFKVAGHIGTFGVISAVTHPFCASCNRIRLSADGMITNCLFSNEKLNLLDALRSGEDVVSLIQRSIFNKKEQRAGIKSFENMEAKYENRSMVAIGG